MTSEMPLRDNCLDSPTSTDVGVLASHMLWPSDDDAEVRDEYIAAIDFDAKLFSTAQHKAKDLSVLEWRSFVNLVRTAARPEDFKDQVAKACERGHIAGHIFHNVVCTGIVNAKPDGLGTRKKYIEDWYQQFRRSHGKSFSRSTIETIWAMYKCVTPYWAARLTFGEQYAAGNQFPCDPADLGTFLAVAMDFQSRGENLSMPKSPETALLRSDEVLRINPRLVLPAGTLYVERLH